jgi:hypothetical protein
VQNGNHIEIRWSEIFNYSAAAIADDRLVRFDGGIGETPASSLTAANIVKGISPGGQPWVIERLNADVRSDGRISVDGRGLLLAGGNGIGTNGGQRVHAILFCGAASFASDEVALEPSGDFPANRWFAAGIPEP